MKDLKVAVVTGGHSYDVPSFHNLFRSLEGIDAYIQHMEDFSSSPEGVRDGYDVILFYHMFLETPVDEGLPWYAGKPRTVLEHLGEISQGILVLHHALLAYPDWSLWDEIVGMTGRKITSYHMDQELEVLLADRDHPITSVLSSWKIIDETYQMAEIGSGSNLLLTVEHPLNTRTLAWARQFRQSRVFCLQLGHGTTAYSNPDFQKVLSNGLRWVGKG